MIRKNFNVILIETKNFCEFFFLKMFQHNVIIILDADNEIKKNVFNKIINFIILSK